MAPHAYAFRPMTARDFKIVQHWLKTPHVAQWWGDPHEQFALISEDLAHPAMDQFIVSHSDRPFAYLQCYDPTRGIDQVIGEEDMIDRGHGSALIRLFVDDLLKAGTPRTVTDPDPGNARAIRAYEKAGFQKDRLVQTPDGRARLMVRDA